MSTSNLQIALFNGENQSCPSLGICCCVFDPEEAKLKFDGSIIDILAIEKAEDHSVDQWFAHHCTNTNELNKYLKRGNFESTFDLNFLSSDTFEVLRISMNKDEEAGLYTGACKLVTREVLLQRELIEKTEAFEEAQAISKVGSWEWVPSTNQVSWSKEMYHIMGLQPDSDNPSFEEIFKYVHPEDVQRLRETSARAVELKKAIPIEYRIITPTGETKHVRGIGQSVLDKDGNLIKLYGTIQDVSDQKKLKSQLDAFWNNSQDLMCINSLEGVFKQVNPKFYQIVGHGPTELASLSLLDIIHPEDRPVLIDTLKELSRKQQTKEFNARIKTQDESVKTLSWSMSSSRVDGLIYTSARDISELISTHQKLSTYSKELLHKNRELEQFAYVASHDLREPLRTIGSFIDLWLKDHEKGLDDHSKEIFDFVQTATGRMEKLINSLLNYSVIGESSDFEETNTQKIVGNVCKDLQKRIKELDAEIQFEDLPVVQASPTAVHQLFLNLINNGLKYNRSKKPLIRIEAEYVHNHWQFSVQDNGIGIKPEDQEKIFKIFERLHNRDIYEGSGIGLAQVQKIITAHNGRIWVKSELGKGSTFYFTLGKQDSQGQHQKLKLIRAS